MCFNFTIGSLRIILLCTSVTPARGYTLFHHARRERKKAVPPPRCTQLVYSVVCEKKKVHFSLLYLLFLFFLLRVCIIFQYCKRSLLLILPREANLFNTITSLFTYTFCTASEVLACVLAPCCAWHGSRLLPFFGLYFLGGGNHTQTHTKRRKSEIAEILLTHVI